MPTLVQLVDGVIPVAADFMTSFNALNGVCGTSTSITTYTAGDTLYASAANTLSKLAKGTDGDIYQLASGVPSWVGLGNLSSTIVGLTLSNDGSLPNTVLDIAAGGCSSDDATLSNRTFMPINSAITKNMNASWAVGSGNGGNNAGASLGASTWYDVFVIKRVDTSVVDVLCDTTLSPTLPSGYTKKRRIGSFKTDGSSHIITFIQYGPWFQWQTPVADYTATAPGTSAVSVTLGSVPTRTQVGGWVRGVAQAGTATAFTVLLSDLAIADAAPLSTTGAPAAPGATFRSAETAGVNSFWEGVIRTNTTQQIRLRCSASTADSKVGVVTVGWYDYLGLYS